MVVTDECSVVVADDVAEVRQLLEDALTLAGHFSVIGTAADGREAVDMVRRLTPDVAVVDIAMPAMDGLEAIPYIRECSPATHIVVLSAFAAAEQEALARGADVFVEKGTPVREIVATIKAFC